MLKLFVSYYKRHYKLFILDMSCALLLAIINLLTPYLIGLIVDDAIPNHNLEQIKIMSIIIFVIMLLIPILIFIISYFGHMMGTKIERDMRTDLFNHLHTLDNKFFVEKRIGELMSRIVGDLRDISEFAHHGPEDLFISVFMIIGSLILMYTINPLLTGIIFLLLVFTVITTATRRTRMARAFTNTRTHQADLNSQTENCLSGISVVKSYANEDFEIERFSKVSSDYQKSWAKAYYQMGWFASVIEFGMKFTLAISIIIGAYLAYNGVISAGEVSTFVLYIVFFQGPVHKLTSFVDQYMKGFSGFKRFYELMQVNGEIESGCVEFKKLDGNIELKNVSFSYGNEPVLDNVSIKIEKNSSVALVGKTGVGKSTIAKLLPRLYDVSKGELLIDGANIKDYTLDSLRRKIGYVEQESYIFFGTIKENILYGRPDASDEEVINASKLASLDEFVNTLEYGYDTNVGSKGIKLSGGQRQRLSLARMFLKKPEILVLDEATSALDNKTELLIQDAIEKLSKSCTSVIIAHRLSTVEKCDVIYVLDETGIIESGSHEQLMSLKGEYYEMYLRASF